MIKDILEIAGIAGEIIREVLFSDQYKQMKNLERSIKI
jgi:hypothetical protein